MKLRIATVLTIMVGLVGVPAGILAVPPPPPKVSPLAAPGKAVADAKAKLELAKGQLLVIRRKVLVVFEAKPEWKAAREAADRAKADFDAQGRLISASLEKNSEYKALMTRRDKDQAIMNSASNTAAASAGDDTAKVSPEDLTAATKDRSAAVLEMKAMEKSVEDSDPNYAAMKQKYEDARAALEAMDKQVDEAVKLDPGYTPAETAITAAESNYKSALEAYKNAAKMVADQNKARTTPRR